MKTFIPAGKNTSSRLVSMLDGHIVKLVIPADNDFWLCDNGQNAWLESIGRVAPENSEDLSDYLGEESNPALKEPEKPPLVLADIYAAEGKKLIPIPKNEDRPENWTEKKIDDNKISKSKVKIK